MMLKSSCGDCWTVSSIRLCTGDMNVNLMPLKRFFQDVSLISK